MKLYPAISDDLAQWAQRQPVFLTGSAPTHGAHINVSPKGLTDSHFAVLGPNLCAYIDRTGSGCETIAHSYDNGRLCLMFMSFGPAPRILRFHCKSRIVEYDDAAFPDLVRRVSRGRREAFDGARAVILCDVFEVQTSCGFGVPQVKTALYKPDANAPVLVEDIIRQNTKGEINELAVFEERPTMDKWASHMAEKNQLTRYQNENSLASLDGLPGMKLAQRNAGQTLWVENCKAKARKVLAERDAMAAGFCLALLLYVVVTGLSAMF